MEGILRNLRKLVSQEMTLEMIWLEKKWSSYSNKSFKKIIYIYIYPLKKGWLQKNDSGVHGSDRS